MPDPSGLLPKGYSNSGAGSSGRPGHRLDPQGADADLEDDGYYYDETGSPYIQEELEYLPESPVYLSEEDGYSEPAPRRRRRVLETERHRDIPSRHPVLSGVGIFIIVLLIVAVGFVWWVNDQINPGGGRGHYVTLTIQKGATTDSISNVLAKKGIIHNALIFRWYVKFDGMSPPQAGTYHVQTNLSYSRTISILQSGPKVEQIRLTIPEGFTLKEIAYRAQSLRGLHLSAKKILRLSSSGSVRSPFEPRGINNLEGLLFPATYQISMGESDAEVLEQMVQAFDQRAQQIHLVSAAKRLHLTPYKLVTVASIVEREALMESDRPDVASVIYNRLSNGTPLGADSTLVYWLRQRNPNVNVSTIDYNQPSPYNTRLHKGLPPTPISNPGLPSLEAAVSPPRTKLQYFVEINSDGKIGFASTPQGFARLQAECRANHLC